jgi:dephospho-CoA kinase
MIVGLTGRYCAGKSWVGSFFEQKGFAIIEVDNLGHAALNDSISQLITTFGEQILNEDKSINRKALGEIVFSNKERLKELEAIVHPKMVKATQALVEKYKNENYKGVVINAALLQRMDLVKLCDRVCYVATPSLIRLKRAVKRDNASLKSFFNL